MTELSNAAVIRVGGSLRRSESLQVQYSCDARLAMLLRGSHRGEPHFRDNRPFENVAENVLLDVTIRKVRGPHERQESAMVPLDAKGPT